MTEPESYRKFKARMGPMDERIIMRAYLHHREQTRYAVGPGVIVRKKRKL